MARLSMKHVASELSGLLDELAAGRRLSEATCEQIERTARRLLAGYGRDLIRQLDARVAAALVIRDHGEIALWSLVRNAALMLQASGIGRTLH